MKLWLTLLALAVIAGATTWLLRQIEPAEGGPEKAASHAPDYYLEGATIRQMSKTGALKYRLASKLITHHPDDNSVDLAEPRISWLGNMPDKTTPWLARAKRGVVPDGGDVVHLIDNVVLTHPEKNAATLKIFTATLDLYTQAREARTRAPVKIVRGASHVNAVGMLIELPQNHMRLQSAVHGVYRQ